jgi:peptidoglycan-associated lipoprotein
MNRLRPEVWGTVKAIVAAGDIMGGEMKRLYLVVALLASGFLISGCAQSKVASSPDSQQQAMKGTEQKESAEGKNGTGKITDKADARVESKEKMPGVREISGGFDDIHFDYDRYVLPADAKPVLRKVADYLLKNSGQKILIEGHCDERGTSEYNLGLGDRRAKVAKDYLVSLGVPSFRVDVMSYGKEKPLCTEQEEDCWRRNRRDHFVLVKASHE